jgi:hypothetical protein
VGFLPFFSVTATTDFPTSTRAAATGRVFHCLLTPREGTGNSSAAFIGRMSAKRSEPKEEFGKRAAECRRLAAAARDPKVRETLEMAAETFEALARGLVDLGPERAGTDPKPSNKD